MKVRTGHYIVGVVVSVLVLSACMIIPGLVRGRSVASADIPAYAVVNPTGVAYFKGWVQVRVDVYLTPESAYYERCQRWIVDATSAEWVAGYDGAVDEYGDPVDPEDYAEWFAKLPVVLVVAPLHHHFIYVDSGIGYVGLMDRLVEVRDYFWTFYNYCWSSGLEFRDEWRKVQAKSGNTVRQVFESGQEPEAWAGQKIAQIIDSAETLDTRLLSDGMETVEDLGIGDKGTITVGADAIDRSGSYPVSTATNVRTIIELNNSASGDGTVDTVEGYFNYAEEGTILRVGCFDYQGANTYNCTDAQEIGEVATAGFHQFTGLSIDFDAGDFIGADGKQSGTLLYFDKDTAGYSGHAYAYNQAWCYIGGGGSFSIYSDDCLSLYGESSEGGAVGYSFGYIIGGGP